MSVRYDYLRDLDDETKLTLQEQASFNSRMPVCSIKIPSCAISQDGTEWLHCVEATKRNNHIYIRVITNTKRGVNIMIPCCITKEIYYKFLDLRFQVRNQDKVLVTFPELYIQPSVRNRELYLRSYDFKVFNPNENENLNNTPVPTIFI